jgi:cysteine desulfurase
VPGSIYLDHAASTPMRPEAIEAMRPYLDRVAANPTGSHHLAQRAKAGLEEARESVAAILGRRPDEIVFTGSGSEADNLALKGAAWALRDSGVGRDGIVVGAMEHKAVLGAADRLERQGFRVTRVRATADGLVDLEHLAEVVDEHTGLVSLMLVNNEVGTVQPLAAAAEIVRERAPLALLHTDAVQAPQWLDVGARTQSFDLVSLSGHKFGGPKGAGVLVRARGVELVPLVEGGGHEWGVRAGTQSVAGIVAFATALRVTDGSRSDETARIARLRDRLESGLFERVPALVANGDPAHRVAGMIHVAVAGIEAEALLVALDSHDVCAAAGSSCSSGATEPSHVLVAMGLPDDRARSSIRLSMGWSSTDADVDRALDVVPECIASLASAAVR